jgi:hypothetical protein
VQYIVVTTMVFNPNPGRASRNVTFDYDRLEKETDEALKAAEMDVMGFSPDLDLPGSEKDDAKLYDPAFRYIPHSNPLSEYDADDLSDDLSDYSSDDSDAEQGKVSKKKKKKKSDAEIEAEKTVAINLGLSYPQ